MTTTEITQCQDDLIIEKALDILLKRLKKPLFTFDSTVEMRKYARLKISILPYEVFSIFFLDSAAGLIAYEEMFRGSLNQTSVYPREVVKRALELNASSIICAHNHPSGNSDPSPSDEQLTQTLKAALALVDVAVLDHLVVCTTNVRSMAEMGLM